ncbi:MAG: cation:proton antiporter [Bacteroidetes bacterium]|nr:cation:proton antiporter [Bacteroidota bacterium]MDA1120451.1 cation:proton antiporter [Bacteroidota bacterium]
MFDYLPLFLVIMVAYLVPMILTWLQVSKVPSIVVQIMVGVIIGPHVLNWVADEPYMEFLAYTGFLFLIFLSGLEIDVTRILNSFPRGRIRLKEIAENSLILSVSIYLGALFLSLPLSWLLNYFFQTDIIFFAILLPTVALSIVVPILKEDGNLTKKFGQIVLMEGALATIMSVLLIAIYSGVLQYGFKAELLLFLIIFLTFGVGHWIGHRLIKIRLFENIQYLLEHAASQIRVRGSVALMLLFVVVASLINTEPFMGAFFAGLLLSIFINKDRSPLVFKLDGMSYGFFIPIFFIMVGVNLDLGALNKIGDTGTFVILLLVFFFISQIIPTLIASNALKLDKALASGFLLSARLGLTIATAQIALSMDLISTETNAGIVIASIFSSILSPLIYNQISGKTWKRYKVYLLGGSKVSAKLAERMQMHDVSYVVIESNPKRILYLKEKNIELIEGDPHDIDLIKNLKIRPQDQVVILTGLDNLNVELAGIMKTELDLSNVLTVVRSEKQQEELKHFNILSSRTDEIIAYHFENQIFRPETHQSLTDHFGAFSVEEFHITNDEINGKRVKELALPPSGSLVVLRRNKEMEIPHGNTHFFKGDVITVIGDRRALEDFRSIFKGDI